MASNSNHLYSVTHHIYPYQKKIIPGMTFHTILVIPYQFIRFVLTWKV